MHGRSDGSGDAGAGAGAHDQGVKKTQNNTHRDHAQPQVSHPPHMMFGAPPYTVSFLRVMCVRVRRLLYTPVHWCWGSDLIEHRIS